MTSFSTSAETGTGQLLWRFAPIVFGPTLLYGLSEGALLPLLPLIAASLGADVSQAALVASIMILARLFGNLPAGWVVSRIGERWTMAAAGVISLAGILILIFARTVPVLAVAVFVMGFSASAFGLSRQAFMTVRVARSHRARAMSLLGGSFRLGMFPGPFIAAGLVAVYGDVRAAAVFAAGCYVLLVALVSLTPDPVEPVSRPAAGTPSRAQGDSAAANKGSGVFQTIRRNRGVLARLGLSAASLSALRQARIYMLPLVGVSLAVDPETISLIVGVTGAIEFLLFYTSGQVMDRWGRLAATLPSMVLMGGAFLMLALTHELPSAFGWFAAAAVVMGIGNGLSSGVLMTLGADLAPRHDPAPFLGSWRTVIDGAGAAVPFAVAGLSAAASLPVAAALLGGVGLLGATGFWRYIPRYVPAVGPHGSRR